MRARALFVVAALFVGGVAVAGPATAQEDSPPIELSVLGTYHTDVFDEAAAEIVAHDPTTQRLYVVNAHQGTAEVLDITDPAAPVKLFELDAAAAVGDPGATVNSVAVRADGVVATATEASDRTGPGWVVFFDGDGEVLNQLVVGPLPDSLTFTPDGAYLLVANEGEPSDDYTVDPEGSVSVIDVSGPVPGLTQGNVRTADFSAWDAGERTLHPDVRIFGPEWTLAEPNAISRNLEPEYVVAAADSATAYVTLQEANAMAVLDITTAEFTDIWPFGFKDHLQPGNELDVSDRDGEIRMASWPVYGMYQPDGFDIYQWQGQTLLVTANEGDSRDWDGWSEESRLRALTDDVPLCDDSPRLQEFLSGNPLGIGTVEQLQDDANLGRLHVTTVNGLRADGGCYEDVYAFGGRSFSIWTADGEQLFDSGSQFERRIADLNPDYFNSNNDENTLETRSDDKGPEPEDVAVGQVGDRVYGFIGLERVGGVMTYDITDPRAPFFVQYVNNRDFTAEPGTREAGDLGAEHVIFIGDANSPTGAPMLVVANEVSGTTTLFHIEDHLADDGTGRTNGGGSGVNDRREGTGGEDTGGEGGRLPVTGANLPWLLATAGLLIALGLVARLLVRRRGRIDLA